MITNRGLPSHQEDVRSLCLAARTTNLNSTVRVLMKERCYARRRQRPQRGIAKYRMCPVHYLRGETDFYFSKMDLESDHVLGWDLDLDSLEGGAVVVVREHVCTRDMCHWILATEGYKVRGRGVCTVEL